MKYRINYEHSGNEHSPDDPRLIPGHPEFVQRPATWEKTVARQIIEIEKQKARITQLTEQVEGLTGKLDFYEQFDHITEVCAADAWHDLAFFEGEDADAQLVIVRAIQRVAGGLRERAQRADELEELLRAILDHPNIPAESVQCCRDAKAYLSRPQ